MTPEQKRAAREAFAYAEELEQTYERTYRGLWHVLDARRRENGAKLSWPDWCLLPMGACVDLAQSEPTLLREHTIAQMSALYAWRHSRSVYLMEHELQRRLLRQVPDAVTLDDFVGLPEWCVYIVNEHPEFPGRGLWAHLEHDINTGRPELRLLIDMDDVVPIPVYLDRDSITEALADSRAVALGWGKDVRGGPMSAGTAELADWVDGCVAVVAYLAREEADVVHGERPGVRAVKPRRAKRDRDVWLVGYSR